MLLCDITGVTDTAIIEAILASERDPILLAKLRNNRVKSSEDIIAKSLKDDYREEHLFILKQEFDSYNFYQRQIAELDKVIESYYETLDKKDNQTPLGEKKSSRPHLALILKKV